MASNDLSNPKEDAGVAAGMPAAPANGDGPIGDGSDIPISTGLTGAAIDGYPGCSCGTAPANDAAAPGAETVAIDGPRPYSIIDGPTPGGDGEEKASKAALKASGDFIDMPPGAIGAGAPPMSGCAPGFEVMPGSGAPPGMPAIRPALIAAFWTCSGDPPQFGFGENASKAALKASGDFGDIVVGDGPMPGGAPPPNKPSFIVCSPCPDWGQ